MIKQAAKNLLKNHTCDNCTYQASEDYCYYPEYGDDPTDKIPHQDFYEKYRTCQDWQYHDHSRTEYTMSQADISELIDGPRKRTS